MRIRSRLLWLVFIAWLPSALAIGVVARSAYIDLRTTALDEVQRLADGLTGTVERELDKRMVMARTLSSSTALQLNDLERFYTEARRATRGADSWVAALRPDAQVLNTTIAYQAGFSVPRLPAGGWLNQGEHLLQHLWRRGEAAVHRRDGGPTGIACRLQRGRGVQPFGPG